MTAPLGRLVDQERISGPSHPQHGSGRVARVQNSRLGLVRVRRPEYVSGIGGQTRHLLRGERYSPSTVTEVARD